ncbi:hypothetical protein F4825DRAFT_338880 [Nemania diffusa]|nr:hypothetical protein F4825DRAFT_338880 [Nemania diffusa]
MPPHGHEINGPQDDVWQRNKTTFRRLYLSERRTLKDVKRVMESEHNFPATPLSTYESKLRDLGLRKKMKRKDGTPFISITSTVVADIPLYTSMRPEYHGTKLGKRSDVRVLENATMAAFWDCLLTWLCGHPRQSSLPKALLLRVIWYRYRGI